MISGGEGGSNTLSGLKFEQRLDLRTVFSKLNGYKVAGNDLFFNDKLIASFYKKHEVYDVLLGLKLKIYDAKSRLSKKLLPDETIFVLSAKTLFIIEMKFQEVAGSVDEKLQTCDFKKKEYIKLFSNTGIKIEYVYILSKWFKSAEYKDVLEYIKSVDCHYFFEELPLEFLGLPLPKK